MNTPAHVVLNALLLRRGVGGEHPKAVLIGALTPDLPILVFYLCQRLARGRSEREIWSTLYFEPAWQLFFDLFNSLPLIALGALIAWRLRQPAARIFFASMALHCLMDLPLHHDDAHRHFLPLSTWRFRSPISYWDPRHFGSLVAGAELLGVLAGSIVLARPPNPRSVRVTAVAVLAGYAVYGVYAVMLRT